MSLDLAAAVLLALGLPDTEERRETLDAVAGYCAEPEVEIAACFPLLTAIASIESGLRHAPGRAHGAGPWQVLPSRPFRWRGQMMRTPRAVELEHPEVGVLWAARVLEAKRTWCRGRGVASVRRCMVEWYNGTAHRRSYARRVLRALERVEEVSR